MADRTKGMSLRERVEEWHWIVTIWHFGKMLVGIASGIAIIIGAPVTLMLGYWNTGAKNYIPEVKDPFNNILSEDIERFILYHRWTIMLFIATILIYFVYLLYRKIRRKVDSVSCLDEISRDYLKIVRDLRSWTTVSLASGRMKSPEYREYVKRLSSDIVDFLISSSNKISALYECYTGKKCHVSIKLYSKGKVKTLARDELSFRIGRSSTDEHLHWYPYGANTAFMTILDDDDCKSFMSNHLIMRSWAGRYINGNPNWKKFYRACLVVPITDRTHPAQINVNDGSVWGFLCVDNRAGGFDEKAARDILLSCGRMYCFLLEILSTIQTDTS